MHLLFFTYLSYRFAAPMSEISHIERNRAPQTENDAWLLTPGETANVIVLKSGFLLPVSRLDDMADIGTPALSAPINPVLLGCLEKNIFSGFVSYKERVYGVLSNEFLRSA